MLLESVKLDTKRTFCASCEKPILFEGLGHRSDNSVIHHIHPECYSEETKKCIDCNVSIELPSLAPRSLVGRIGAFLEDKHSGLAPVLVIAGSILLELPVKPERIIENIKFGSFVSSSIMFVSYNQIFLNIKEKDHSRAYLLPFEIATFSSMLIGIAAMNFAPDMTPPFQGVVVIGAFLGIAACPGIDFFMEKTARKLLQNNPIQNRIVEQV